MVKTYYVFIVVKIMYQIQAVPEFDCALTQPRTSRVVSIIFPPSWPGTHAPFRNSFATKRPQVHNSGIRANRRWLRPEVIERLSEDHPLFLQAKMITLLGLFHAKHPKR